jgi:hypothetical protein
MPLIIRRCVTKRLLQFDIGQLRLVVAQDVPLPSLTADSAAPASAQTTAALGLLRSVSGAAVDGAAAFTGTAARDWTRIKERMRYVFALFRAFHTEPEVCSMPYDASQLAAIAAGQRPAGTL